MNKHNIKYLAKILCLKAKVAHDPFATISKDVLSMYDITTNYGDIVSIVTVVHKIDTKVTVFQVFNEASVNYSPINNDYGVPIIITSYLQPEHNKFPISFLYIDAVASDLFPTFKRLTQEEYTTVTSVLLTGNKKESLKLPRMLDTELSAKILYHKEYPAKIIRFFRSNLVTGLEIADRSVANVIE
ncbi:RNA polymerase [Pteropox virus]|uniref:DNA-directed RNA polymerase subunit n=1 Tax=Pteropox virus TaxID=1873698 RepID=A0A1B1MRC0_9POXV|nr:RNA polymerase [Pteropox virus]ANS71156.1 RNA polymerase [Pteropox virus]